MMHSRLYTHAWIINKPQVLDRSVAYIEKHLFDTLRNIFVVEGRISTPRMTTDYRIQKMSVPMVVML